MSFEAAFPDIFEGFNYPEDAENLITGGADYDDSESVRFIQSWLGATTLDDYADSDLEDKKDHPKSEKKEKKEQVSIEDLYGADEKKPHKDTAEDKKATAEGGSSISAITADLTFPPIEEPDDEKIGPIVLKMRDRNIDPDK